MTKEFIEIINASENNLKNINVSIPKKSLVVITGPSGSGKSSLAFDTLYAEGQRRYVESMSNYAKQFLNIQKKPQVDSITGLCPAIAIDQKNTSNNPRSTVGTVTEIYDFLRMIFARIGVPYSRATGLPMKKQTSSEIINTILNIPIDTKIRICAPVIKHQKGQHIRELQRIFKTGYSRVKINEKVIDISNGDLPVLDKNEHHTIEVIVDRIIIKEDSRERVVNAVESALKVSGNVVNIDIVEMSQDIAEVSPNTFAKNKETLSISTNMHCAVSGITIDEIEPRMFSFNSPYGCCDSCDGLGTEKYFSEDLVVDENLTLNTGAIRPWATFNTRYYSKLLVALSEKFKINLDLEYSKLPKAHKEIIMRGSNEKIKISMNEGFVKDSAEILFNGVLNELEERFEGCEDSLTLQECEKYQTDISCRKCGGHRLNEKSLSIKINELHIGEVCSMSVLDALAWFKELPKFLTENQKDISKLAIKEIINRLGFLENVGLGYLQISRSAATLSGGESQRIRLASQIGSGLSGVLYVLDEPSIGLHQSDNEKLILTLKKLRDLDNSVVVIEHDEDTMRNADYIIDVGPGAGKYGGYIISKGTIDEVGADTNSITGGFLSGRDEVPMPKSRRAFLHNQEILIKGAREHNLKNLTVKFPVGVMTVVCGVSGGGKSTIVNDILYKAVSKKLYKSHDNPGLHDEITGLEHVDKVISIDQSPIGRTPRSNPATYIGLFNLIRDVFTSLPESKTRGYEVGRFSFNVKGGRCENCQGDGFVKIEMHFLPDVYVPCEVCGGKRYNAETLEVKYKGYSISDVLNMDVRDALVLFSEIPYIKEKLLCLESVGLEYLKLGQPSNELSGGEAQRIKLAKELSKKSTGSTLYILDEPTTGLHMCDIKRLLKVLHRLVDNGNTMIVIEHNLDVIKTADYVIDIGPVGGSKGGYIVAEGSPVEVANNPNSVTGTYLKKLMKL